MKFSAVAAISNRRSVRTFDGNNLRDSDLKALEDFIKEPLNPFGTPVNFRILDPEKYSLSSPVISGESLYLAAKVKREENYELGFGYSFEHACLYACSLGIGTVMLASTLSRDRFETAMEVKEDEILPVASPLGYPASRMSFKERLMRQAIKADRRQPFSSICFEGSFSTPLNEDKAGVYKEALKLAILSPSAVNKQPFRAVVDGNTVHFFEYRTLNSDERIDIQKVDMGIFLCHFDLCMKEKGNIGSFYRDEVSIETPEHVIYTISFKI